MKINDGVTGFPELWTMAGYLLLGGAAIFVGRIVYEETVLTWSKGPQMVGFAMMHGALPYVLLAGFIGVPGSLLWAAASLVFLIRRRFRGPITDWLPIPLFLVVMLLFIVPYESWEELMVRIAGPGANEDYVLIQAAAQDNTRFVTLLLGKGYDINYEDRGGTTALSGAAVGGHEEMVSFLIPAGLM